MTQSRWLSKYMWAAYVSLAMLILGNYGLYDLIGMDSNVFQRLMDLVFIVITGYGVGNNPTDKEKY